MAGARASALWCVEFFMRMAAWPPSIVPSGDDQTVCLVMDDLGRNGRVWCGSALEVQRRVLPGKASWLGRSAARC